MTILNETTLNPLKTITLKPFFSEYPIFAIEYLSIPYFFMIFLDLYLSGRISAFSWSRFSQFLSGTFLHTKQTFEEVIYHKSILFSLVSVVLVSLTWIIRTVVFSTTGFIVARRRFIPFSVNNPLELITKTTVTIPAALSVWLIVSVLVHVVARQFNGKGCYSEMTSLIGFAFLPSLITVIVDFLEMGFQIGDLLVSNVIFLILGLVVPLILWPLILVIFAIQTSERLELRSAILTATIAFLPLFTLLSWAFL